jgi:hypothetical protein
VTRPRAADDFATIRARMHELRRENTARPRAADDFPTIRARIEDLRRERTGASAAPVARPLPARPYHRASPGSQNGKPRRPEGRVQPGSSSLRPFLTALPIKGSAAHLLVPGFILDNRFDRE